MFRKHIMKFNSCRSGNAAVIVILLLLAGAAAWFFLFRTPADVELPAAGDSAAAVTPEAQPGGAAEMTMEEVAEISAEEIGEVPINAAGEELPVTADGTVDWQARYTQLKKQYAQEFNGPKVGMKTTLQLATGTIVKGTLSHITADKITVSGKSAKATYSRSQLSPRSQVMMFQNVYAAYAARQVVLKERAEAAPAPQ